MTVSECADAHAVLDKSHAEPGPFETDRVPYLRHYQDLLGDPNIDVVAVMKCSQSAFSEGSRMGLHYWVRQDPGETLWVFPDEKSVKKTFTKHLRPLCNLSLKDYLTGRAHDISEDKGIQFTTMSMSPAWAGSPQSLASDAYRYVVFDEVDKYPIFSGREADPISLGTARTRTYGYRAKIVIISTPTVRSGAIASTFYSIADRRYFWIPCTACDEFQIMTWKQVQWPDRPKGEDRADFAERVEREQLARYECIHCKYQMDDGDRLDAVECGEWRSRLKDTTGSRQVALHISSLYSVWTNLSSLAQKFLKAKIIGVTKLMEFVTQELGEPFEEVQAKTPKGLLETKAAMGFKRRVIPPWAGVVIASADMQKNGLWYVVRAWGRGYRSRLIDFGFADGLEMLYDLTMKNRMPIEGSSEYMSARYLFIDSGGGIIDENDASSTDKVYRFSLKHQGKVFAVKGQKQGGAFPVNTSYVKYEPPDGGKAYKVNLKLLNVHHFKDILSNSIKDKDSSLWEICGDVDDDYKKQMTSEHKVFVRSGRSKQGKFMWKPVSEGAANHIWDAEVYNRAGAHMLQADELPSQEELERERKALVNMRREMSSPSGQSRYLREGRKSHITRR